jgi:hypothetical protein
VIDWQEPAHGAHVLDWRARAAEYGLLPDDVAADSDRQSPQVLLEEEEQEAYAPQPVAGDLDADADEGDDSGDELVARGRSEEVDLVRVPQRIARRSCSAK